MAVEGGVRVGGLKEGHLRRTSTPSRGRCQYSDSLHTYEIATSSVAGKRYIFKFSWARNINFDSHEGIPTEPQRLNSVGHCYVHMWHTRTVKEGFKECIRFVYISLVFPPFYGFAAENRGRRCTFFLLERPSWFCNVLSLTISQFIWPLTPAYSTVLLSRSRTLYCQDRQCQRPRMS